MMSDAIATRVTSLTSPPPPPPPPPAPPPPPPRPPPLERTLSEVFLGVGGWLGEAPGGVVCEDPALPTARSLAELVRIQYLESRRRQGGQDSPNSLHFLCVFRPVSPVIQRGPLCGLVALAMAARLLGREEVTSEVILDHAVARGFSRQGEMFSAESLRTLSQELLQCETSLNDVTSCPWHVSQLLSESLLLVPYDADKNHQPCQLRGHKAHWALLTGFCLVLEGELTAQQTRLLQTCQTDDHQLYWGEGEAILSVLKAGWRELPAVAYVFGRQGKSRGVGVWRWGDVVDSSRQLMELGPERSSDPQGYVVPPGGLTEALAGQCVRIALPGRG